MSSTHQEHPAILSDAVHPMGEAPLLNVSPFEGPEKLLEIWFAPSAKDVSLDDDFIDDRGVRKSGLRKVKREEWEEMLAIVKCQVLSVVEGRETDAYLLSESSLFVSPHRLILKTCGTTLNLLGLPKILAIAAAAPCHLTEVYRLFYSRKSFMFPERQQGPHREWKEEVAFLDRMFGTGHQAEGWRGSGSAYTVGSVNRDHWLLYMTGPVDEEEEEEESAAGTVPNGVPHLSGLKELPDFTIEILMSKLSSSARRPFLFTDALAAMCPPVDPSPGICEDKEVPRSPNEGQTPLHTRGLHLSHELGISDLFPRSCTTLDAFAFEPCGYSANALVQHRSGGDNTDGGEGEGYYTIHVTPEEGWSYASFESNVPLPPSATLGGKEKEKIPDLQTLIQRVVEIFQPGHLSVTLFVSSCSSDAFPIETAQATFYRALTAKEKGFNYRRTDKINYEFGGYDLAFASFERKERHQHRRSADWDIAVAPP